MRVGQPACTLRHRTLGRDLGCCVLYNIRILYVTYKDKLSRISFDMFKRLFSEFGCEIIVINDTDDKANETEIFEEIISMLHCFAMRMYSRRRKKKLEIMEEDLKNEISL